MRAGHGSDPPPRAQAVPGAALGTCPASKAPTGAVPGFKGSPSPFPYPPPHMAMILVPLASLPLNLKAEI